MSKTDAADNRLSRRIGTEEMAAALTQAPLAYADGATQVFTADGRTTYTENGAPTAGEWSVDDQGRFCSFWPPSYRAVYELFYLLEDGRVIGVQFVDLQHGTSSEGRYTDGGAAASARIEGKE